jgi:cytochrome c biogenesis protein CcmG/thiol:disulfide interchange protein DsbE
MVRWVIGIVCVLLSVACGSAPVRASAPSPLLGKPVKDFKRPTLAGATLDTSSFRGRVVVVEFFAKYCKPCEKALPATASLSRELGGVAFVGVSEDEHALEADTLAKRHNVTFPVVHDAGNVIAGRFRVSEMPATFVIDRAGTVRWVGSAEHTTEDLRQAISEAER